MTVLAADSADIPKPSLEKLCTGFVFLNARFQVQSVHSSAKTSLTHLLPAPSSCLLITHISPQTISFLASNFPKTRPPPRRWPPPRQGDHEDQPAHGHGEEPLQRTGRRDLVHAAGEPRPRGFGFAWQKGSRRWEDGEVASGG